MKNLLLIFTVFCFSIFSAFADASYLGSWKIDDYLTFPCNTHDPDTGVATDAASVPTYRIYEDETGAAILTGSTAKLDDANTVGFYSERIQLTAASGLEKGKSYTIYITATVDGDAGTMSHTFQMEAEVDANIVSATNVSANMVQIGGVTQSATDLKDFADAGYDPATNKVQGVVLVDTTTANSDLVSAAAVVNEWESQSQADPTGFHVNVLEISGTAQTANDNGADINAILTDTGTTLENRLIAVEADTSAILTDTGTTLDTLIKDIPTVAEFNARSIVSANYVVVGDTIAAVTVVNGLAANVITAASINANAIGASEIAANAITSSELAASAVDEILDEIVDNDGAAISLRGAIKLMLSVLTGKSSGGGTNTITFRDLGDSKNRISATVTGVGDRTAVVRDAS